MLKNVRIGVTAVKENVTMLRNIGIAVAAIVALVVAWNPAARGADKPAEPAKELALDLGGGMSLKLVLIPAGKFMMGSPENEKDRNPNEGPQHEVTISKPFYMGIYPVTQEQYTQVKGRYDGYGEHPGPKNPAVGIDWSVAVEWCKLLSEKTGRTVRLPTEAEREYACRAGTTTRFPYGHDPEYAELGDYAWYGKNFGGSIQPVGEKKPNPWGLYDMLGNSYDWCSDIAVRVGGAFIAYEANAPVTDPTGVKSDDPRIEHGVGLHVVRGSSWHLGAGNAASRCRSACRAMGNRDQSVGFRVVVEVAAVRPAE